MRSSTRHGAFLISSQIDYVWPFRWKVVVRQEEKGHGVTKTWVAWQRHGRHFGRSQGVQGKVDDAIIQAEDFIATRGPRAGT